MDIIRQRQMAADGSSGVMSIHSAQETLSKHLKTINQYDEVISSVQLDLAMQRL
jgi:hypothetical protein